jgi:hypothetical protein
VPDELEGFFDREQVLGGSPARRASALLFAIEGRTARLAARARRRMQRFVTEEGAQDRALAYVEAFSRAREGAVVVTAQQLERHAAGWAPLVPDNAQLRAALARRLGEKYRFTSRVAPGITRALGLDRADVQAAFERLYGEPVEAVYARTSGLRERLRWHWVALARRLETMPPFWAAYALVLTETVGVSVLALPIAVAGIGPLAGVAVLAVIGLVNVLTVAFLAEAVARSGPMRYGGAFLGRLVGDYFGRAGSFVLSGVLFLFCAVALAVLYVGFGTTLEATTGVPGEAWVALLFVVGFLYLRRESVDATVATALVVGATNIALVLAISLLALTHADGDLLTHSGVSLGQDLFDPSLAGVVFGVALFAYFGHTAVAIGGSIALERDPTGRALVWGCASATATAIVVYCLFVLAANSAVAPGELTAELGTAVGPLAAEVGPGVTVLGTAFVVLAMGMGSIYLVLDLFELVRERLPALGSRVLVLPRRGARLVFTSRRHRLRLGVGYLGPASGGARFSVEGERAGTVEQEEIVVAGRWEWLDLPDERLTIELLDVAERRVRVAVTTSLRLVYEGEAESGGLSLAEVLESPGEEAGVVAWLARTGEATAGDLAAHLGTGKDEARRLARRLVAEGLAVESSGDGEPRFSARLARRRGSRGTTWEPLLDAPPRSAAVRTESRWRDVAFGRTGRFLLSAAPVVAIFAVSEWLLATGTASFTELIAFAGEIALTLIGGVFPVLLLVASRRRGAYVSHGLHRVLTHPVLLLVVYTVFLLSLVLHGVVIWHEPLERVAALGGAVAMVVLPLYLLRAGAFDRRLTVELRDDERAGTASLGAVSGGSPAAGEVLLEYDGAGPVPARLGPLLEIERLRRAVVRTTSGAAAELKVWAHRVTPEGESEPLPARARVGPLESDLALSRGEALFSLDGDVEVEIFLGSRP